MRIQRTIYFLALCVTISAARIQSGAQSPAQSPASPTQSTSSGTSTQTAAPASAQIGTAQSGSTQTTNQLRVPDVIYVPTPPEVVAAMLKVANVKQGDVLYDLGSGDGRIPITAAQKFGVRAVGIDINPERIKEANENAQKAGVTDRVQFLHEDLFEADISEATVVTLYLLDSLNEKLRPKLLRELKPGTRIVSHSFRMGEWQPEQTIDVNGRMVYFWTVPAKGAATGN
ncbi:MAG: class I SAM-dependent methyltransferase [Acidobacteria bacterium]|nr:class I SAM-dependent methyltransferase [Acidobacteriota bacterium]